MMIKGRDIGVKEAQAPHTLQVGGGRILHHYNLCYKWNGYNLQLSTKRITHQSHRILVSGAIDYSTVE